MDFKRQTSKWKVLLVCRRILFYVNAPHQIASDDERKTSSNWNTNLQGKDDL